jgi:hypothetical protein
MTNLMRRILIVVPRLAGRPPRLAAHRGLRLGQALFPSYLVYSVVSGIAAGAAMGAFFGSAEGLLAARIKRPSRAR